MSGEERLAAFEDGQREPSRPLLLRMARQYRRPLLTFYMSAAPRTGERGQDFRTLPPEHSRAQDALVDALIRNVRARQEMVRAVLEDEDEAVRLPFVASKTMRDDVTAVLQSIRETLNLDLDQYRGRKPGKLVPSGFTYLRAQAERVGIYVLLIGNLGSHHTSLDVETFRGFALADDLAPFIVMTEMALRIWAETQPTAGSLVETYLRSRSINIPSPPSLRFHPALRHSRRGRLDMVLLLIRGDLRRCQAEIPLIPLFRFAEPALWLARRAHPAHSKPRRPRRHRA